MADLKDFAEQLVNLTVKEVNELAGILKDEYGIEPAAAAVAVAASGDGGGDVAAEQTEFDVILKAPGGAKLGVVKYDGSKLDTSFNGKASLIIPAGAKGPKFLVYNNFRRILNWNNSDFYALAVGLLSDDIIGIDGMNWVPPKNEKSISRNDYKFVQKVLKSYAYYNSKIDGVFASGSKHSLKLYQEQHNLPADGHLSNEVLKYIKGNK